MISTRATIVAAYVVVAFGSSAAVILFTDWPRWVPTAVIVGLAALALITINYGVQEGASA